MNTTQLIARLKKIIVRYTGTDADLLDELNLVHQTIQDGVIMPGTTTKRYWAAQKIKSENLTYAAAATSVATPEGCIKVRTVKAVLSGGATAPIEAASEDEVETLLALQQQLLSQSGVRASIVQRWFPIGRAVGIVPAPSTAITIQLGYFGRLPDYTVSTALEPVVTDWFSETVPLVLCYGAAASMALNQRDYDAAQIFNGIYEKKLLEAILADGDAEAGGNSDVYRPPVRGVRSDM